VTCERIADRLYDEDCRRVLSAETAPPPDVRGHLAVCSDCHAAWDEAAEDLRIVGAAILDAAPTALERRLRIAFADRVPEPANAAWASRLAALAGAAAIGAIAMLAASQALPPPLAAIGSTLLCITGASVGFAGSAVFEAFERRT
jgi:hypothetical protein